MGVCYRSQCPGDLCPPVDVGGKHLVCNAEWGIVPFLCGQLDLFIEEGFVGKEIGFRIVNQKAIVAESLHSVKVVDY